MSIHYYGSAILDYYLIKKLEPKYNIKFLFPSIENQKTIKDLTTII